MRENRPYGSEGGAARKGRLYPYPGKFGIPWDRRPPAGPGQFSGDFHPNKSKAFPLCRLAASGPRVKQKAHTMNS